ncbi:hypothetical protein K435DRAFT_968605 [Dendrothele bispora CBS 962.96]|uniref:Uncharacterized protein n=1 Tax=Dendrothele bispora (strain CBS 962.96) TaxID=1314807 RepID=A0A4S8LMV7_DENBC|nr:hypothetical protein K435DRAFT_968605 [Dendrothele bispora CBS 962.96]
MPRPTPFVPKAPIEKLPLAVRKAIRDSYESEKEGFEKQISDRLGVEFKVNLNPNEIWAYSTETTDNTAGEILKRYVSGFAYCLRNFIEKYGEEGKNDFNGVVTAHELSVAVNPLGDKAPVIDCEIRDGVFFILFNHKNLGSSTDYISDALLAALDAAPREGLSTKAKYSVDQDYDSTIDEVQEAIGKLLAMPDVELEPSFEANFKALKAYKKDDTWQEGFGRASFDYYEGFRNQLGYQGFKDDEMLQEGLAEQFTTKKIVLQVVDKTTAMYNEVAIEEGTVYIRTVTPEYWWYNTAETGKELVNLL